LRGQAHNTPWQPIATEDMAANLDGLARFAGAELDKPTEQLKGVSVSDDEVLMTTHDVSFLR
jgi:hypothetical protein